MPKINFLSYENRKRNLQSEKSSTRNAFKIEIQLKFPSHTYVQIDQEKRARKTRT